jgi:cytochrome P450
VRRAAKPYTFSNGVTIPKGTYVGAPMWGIHMDDTIYENAKEFDGFRFSKLRENMGENAKFLAVNTNNEYLHFGHGIHAW